MNTTQIQYSLTSPAVPSPASTKARVKVTYVAGSLRDGGAERQVLELIRNLNRQWFVPSLILLEDVTLDRAQGWATEHFVMDIPEGGNSRWLTRSFSMARAVRRTAAQLSAWGSDVVHAFSPGPSILGGMAARMAKVPVFVGSRHSLVSLYRSRGGLVALADRLAFHLADVTLGPSEAVTREMISLGGCPRRKCCTLYNGVDTSRFRPDLPRWWRTKMGWNEQDVVFGMVANFRACKGHADFVQAAAQIAQRNPEARFVMVGADQGLKAATEQQVRKLELGDKTRIVDVDPSPEKIFAAMDVCVCTSTSEAFGLVLAEAMACGRPVIATAVGGIPEVVRCGETGFLVPVGSPSSVAEAAESLLRDPARRRVMGMSGRLRAEQNFSLDRMVSRHEQLYLQLLSERKRTAA